MLVVNPMRRVSAAEALSHDFVKMWHCEEDNCKAEERYDEFEWNDEKSEDHWKGNQIMRQ